MSDARPQDPTQTDAAEQQEQQAGGGDEVGVVAGVLTEHQDAQFVIVQGHLPVVGPATMTRDTAQQAYEQAGVGPEEVDLALCHDAFANEELEYYELLGFCPEGDAEKLVEEGQTEIGGRHPVNTDGGCLANGEPIGASGLRQVYENVLQLRGDAGDHQVPGAKTALGHAYGGGAQFYAMWVVGAEKA